MDKKQEEIEKESNDKKTKILIKAISSDIKDVFGLSHDLQWKIRENIIKALETWGIKKWKKVLEFHIDKWICIDDLFSTATAKLIFEILGNID